jgi:FKBP-type peptidyl-prolyl cis-trans isomerase SlpA
LTPFDSAQGARSLSGVEVSDGGAMITINEYSKVTLHFSLATDGDLQIDSTFDREPATFVMGDGSLLPGFEKKLSGLKAGDERMFLLSASEAFGDINPDSIYRLDKQQFDRMDLLGNELSEGLIVSFAGAGKRPMPGIVKKIEGDKVTVDFNHPLAGQKIKFVVNIVRVENVAMEQRIAVKNT